MVTATAKGRSQMSELDAAGPGRVAQRRRTRKAIVDATTTLLTRGLEPSVADIAAEADVSRRTVYLYFPTLDQLILDATVGAMTTDVDAALAKVQTDDPHVRVAALVNALSRNMTSALPLGRRLIKLTVDAPNDSTAPRRGYRRVRWLEWSIEPLRPTLTEREFEDLVSALALVIGWEAFIVLIDVRGLTQRATREISLRAASTLIDAAVPIAR
jgi:AcrR family transcriptional regulator